MANCNSINEVVELVLQSVFPRWAVVQYKAVHYDLLDSWHVSAMFSDGRSWKMFDIRGVRRETAESSWERHRTLLRL